MNKISTFALLVSGLFFFTPASNIAQKNTSTITPMNGDIPSYHGKKPKSFTFNHFQLKLNSFAGKIKSQEFGEKLKGTETGSELSLSFAKPRFPFLFIEGVYKIEEKVSEIAGGPAVETHEDQFRLKSGFGMMGYWHIFSSGFVFGGEAKITFEKIPEIYGLPLLGWENHKETFAILIGNQIRVSRPGMFNPFLILEIKLFDFKIRTHKKTQEE